LHGRGQPATVRKRGHSARSPVCGSRLVSGVGLPSCQSVSRRTSGYGRRTQLRRARPCRRGLPDAASAHVEEQGRAVEGEDRAAEKAKAKTDKKVKRTRDSDDEEPGRPAKKAKKSAKGRKDESDSEDDRAPRRKKSK
jgi:hypothetical protein